MVPVKGCLLMRILSIPQFLGFSYLERQGFGKSMGLFPSIDLTEVVGNGAVVAGRMLEHFFGQAEVGLGRNLPFFFQFRKDQIIILRVNHHGHIGIVLRRRTEHGGPADIDVFDRFLKTASFFSHGRLKGIEIDSHKVDGKNSMFFHFLNMLFLRPLSQKPAVDFRMKGLHSTIQHLRKPGVIRNIFYRDSLISQ
jgi:hypothetical protein